MSIDPEVAKQVREVFKGMGINVNVKEVAAGLGIERG